MSRSYRKPFVVDGYRGSKRKAFFKNYANRIIRRTMEEIPDGSSFIKFTGMTYDICDYRWLEKDPKWIEKIKRK